MIDAPTDRAEYTPPLAALPAVVLDERGAIRYVSPSLERFLGVSFREGIETFVHPDDVAALATGFVAVADGWRASTTATVRARAGDDRVYSVEFFAHPENNDGIVALFRDVSRRWWLQQVHRSLPEVVDELLDEGSFEATARRLLEWLSSVGYGRPGFYRLDPDESQFDLVSLHPADGDQQRETTDAVVDVFRRGVASSVDEADLPEPLDASVTPSNTVAVPVGDYGVLVATIPTGTVPVADRQSALSTVARLLGLVFDRRDLRRSLDRSSQSLQASAATVDHLTDLVRIVQDVEEAILAADSVEAVERALCHGLVRLDAVEFVWVGSTDVQDEELVPNEWAGRGRAYLNNVTHTLDDESLPAIDAVRTGSYSLVSDVAEGLGTVPWRREALACGFQTVLAAPIEGENASRGVVTVYGRETDAFDDVTVEAIAHLGRFAGFVTNLLELRRTFLGNSVVELEIRVPPGETILSRLAERFAEPLSLLSAVPRSDGSTRLFFTTPLAPERVEETTDAVPGIGDVRHHSEREDGNLFEVTVAEETVPTVLASLGAMMTDATADRDGVLLTVEIARTVDVRNFVESVRSVYPGAELLARRMRDRPIAPERRFRMDFERELTDRQREVFEAAHFGGYFDWPREHTGAELADSLGMSQPTFSRHLRAAQRTLARLLFESTEPDR